MLRWNYKGNYAGEKPVPGYRLDSLVVLSNKIMTMKQVETENEVGERESDYKKATGWILVMGLFGILTGSDRYKRDKTA